MKKIKTLIFMFMATVLSKCLALVRTIIFANYFGTSSEANAYFAASNILLQFLEIFMLSVICSSFIPIYSKIEVESGRKEAIKYSQTIKRTVFHNMANLKLSEKFHLRYFALHIENLAKAAENVADQLAVMAIRRTL